MNKNSLKALREALNLTAKDVYSNICDRRTYNKIEADITSGKLEILLAICQRLGISLNELLHYHNLEGISKNSEVALGSNHSENMNNLAISIDSIRPKKFYNPKLLSRFVGLKAIAQKHSKQLSSLTLSPKDINEIIHYYEEKKVSGYILVIMRSLVI